MPEAIAQPEASTQPLSQIQRVVDTFVAPSKTFQDIQRSANWLLPYLIGVVVTLALGFTIQQKVGWTQTYQNMLKQSPATQQALEQLPPDQQAKRITLATDVTKYIFWLTPAVALIMALVAAGVLLGTINFGFGGRAKFGQMMAVWMFATLPWSIQGLLGIASTWFVDPEAFNLKNFVGTNLGYWMPPDWPKALIALGTALDATTIWALILLTIGCSIIGKVKRGQAAAAVWGWWVIIVALKVVGAKFS